MEQPAAAPDNERIIVICPRTFRMYVAATDSWVKAIKRAPFPDGCVVVKEPRCVLFVDRNEYPTRVSIQDGETLTDALAAIVSFQNALLAVERQNGGKLNG